MWDKSIEEVFEKLKTSKNGLTQIQAEERLKIDGKNEIPKAKNKTIFKIFIEQFKSPIVLILLIAAIFSIFTKSYADAIFIFAVIIINAVIGTYQEWNSEKNSEKLANLIKINSKVLRDEEEKQIASENIVLGDIVLLESGDKVPADLRLIETNNLAIDESILTGESIQKDKDIEIKDEDEHLADRSNMAYAGSIVTKGRGKGVVVAVSQNTEFGKVANNVLISKEEESPLVVRMNRFVKQISIGFLILAVLLCIVLYFKGYTITELFSTVVALTVSAIPEGLTIAMTIVLSIASSKMAKRNVIVKKLNAVESLGSCTRIATDKTGTLTVNEQTAKKILLPNGKMAYIKGVGYNDIGSVEFDEESSKLTKKQAIQIAKMGYLNNEASLKFKNGKWIHHGDAIDTAFLALAYKMDVKDVGEVVYKIPYESKNKYSAVFIKEEGNFYVTVKGAVERVLEFCNKMQIEGQDVLLDYNKIILGADKLSNEGFRVIAVAKGETKQEEYEESKIRNLTFLGLVAFVDPIREDVIEAVAKCKKAGIKVSMITGDYSLTANAIAKRIGIEDVHSRVSPIGKLEIVENFKKQGDFIAVTGDGVNDTPALKAANIGVAMGSGTDIAKETGNMIIVDDNFSSIVNGVEEGRKAYNNIRKVIYLLLSTGFSEIILFVFTIIFGMPIPLVAIQLLWLNLISNGIQGDALAFEKDTEDVMNKKVKNTKEKIFNKLMVQEIAISSITMALIEFFALIYLLKIKHYDLTLIRSYLLTLMVFMENIHIFNCRSEVKSIFKTSMLNNRFLMLSILITSIIEVMIVSYEPWAKFFNLTVIPVNSIWFLLLLTVPILVVMEIYKFVKRNNEN